MNDIVRFCIGLVLMALFIGTIPPVSATMDYLAWRQLSEKGTRELTRQRYDDAEFYFWASIQSLAPYPASATKDYELYFSYAQLATIYKIRKNPVDEFRCRMASEWHQFWGYSVAIAPMKFAGALPYWLVAISALETLFALFIGLRECPWWRGRSGFNAGARQKG